MSVVLACLWTNLTFTFAFVSACANAGMWERSLELLKEMEENGIKPNEISYSVAIKACSNGGQWKQALALLDQVCTILH